MCHKTKLTIVNLETFNCRGCSTRKVLNSIQCEVDYKQCVYVSIVGTA